MQEQAYSVLRAIGRGDVDRIAGQEAWLEAFQTIRWALKTDRGVILTAEGRHALADMNRKRSKPH